jgi:hypothetical protein
MRVHGRFVAAALVASVVAGCLPKPNAWLVPSGDGIEFVGVVGDSLIAQADADVGAHDLRDALTTAGFAASLSAQFGASTANLADAALVFDTPGPDIDVIALGTNDAHDGHVATATSMANITRYLDSSSARCTALVDIAVTPAWELDVYAPPLDRALRDLAAARDDVVVADWSGAVQAHPEYLADAPHHSEAGRAAYRELVVDAAKECAGRLTGATTTVEPPTTTTTMAGPATTMDPDTTTTQPGTTTTQPDTTTTADTPSSTTEPPTTAPDPPPDGG